MSNKMTKEDKKEYMRIYRQKNKEKIKLQKKKYKENNKQKILAKAKDYRNTEKGKELNRKYREENKEELKAKKLIYNQTENRVKSLNTYEDKQEVKVLKKVRWITRDLEKRGLITLKIKCEHLENVEIHHEIYPKTRAEIIKAVEDGKIYKLCQKCHKDLHKRKVFKLKSFKYIIVK